MAKEGLEGVVVTQSSMSYIDGAIGKLVYRGYDILDLAEHCTFEEAAYLMWFGELPNAAQLQELTHQFASHRPSSVELQNLLRCFPPSSPTMSVLRTAVSLLGIFDPRTEADALATNRDMAIEISAQTASIVAAFHRMRNGEDPLTPDPRRSHAWNFLYMMNGEPPDPLAERVFDNCLLLHLDHGFNASTFAARVTAATLSDIYSAITSAIGTLRGPLHGGANRKVMMMLREIGAPDKAEAYIKDLLARKERVMGFGHRVYKSEDPRATVLRNWCKKLAPKTGKEKWAEMSEIIERVMMEEKGLCCNVDFYSASVYDMLGIPDDLFTPIFAVSRVVGWTAHVLEQYDNNRLIRPACDYTGPKDLKVVPLEQRQGK